MKKRIRFFGLFTLSFWLMSGALYGCANAQGAQYGRKIVLPPKPGTQLEMALPDLLSTLGKMTGAQFTAGQEYSGPGIYLVRSDMEQAPADAVAKLKGKGFEPFIIRSKDASNLWIIANSDLGLSHGVYYYLDWLGARWLLPNENWTIVPQRDDITLKIDTLVAPAFKVRGFFGTGGFGPIAPYDPKTDRGMLKFQARVLDWQRRNRFGAEYHLDGHAGEAFNLENKEVLMQHPEYLAEIDGKRGPWSVTAKLDPSNPDAVKLFVNWALEKYRQKRKSYPNSPYSVAVSVDPSDGGGHCNSGPCTQIGNGSPSDQVFYVANQVAKAVRAEFPDGKVNLYAYNQHAAAPSIPIEPNVIVMIIPYAFQNTGLTPQEFIKAWGQKLPGDMNLYDYWSITDWTQDEPSFDYLSTPAQKLRFWHENRIVGFHGESTYSAGAMGLGWYVASRLMWDPKVDEKAVIEEWYDLAFGPAKAPMKKMLERWAKTFMLTSAELGLSYQDLSEAMRLGARDDAVSARLDDYARYLHYLRLKLELSTLTDPAQRAAKEREYVEYLFDIYDSTMVHSFRLYQFAVDYGRKLELFNEFQNEKADAPGWARVAPLSHAEVAALVADGLKKYPAPSFETVAYSGDLEPLGPIANWTPPAGDDMYGTRMPTKGALDVHLIAPRGMKELPLRVSLYYDLKINVVDGAGKSIFKRDIKGIKEYEQSEEMRIPIPRQGHYKIEFRPGAGGGFWFRTAKGTPLSFGRFISEMGAPSPRLYFYVPKGLKTIALYYPHGHSGGGVGLIHNPQDEPVKPELHDGGKLVTVPVGAGQDGQVWSFEGSRSPNAPHRMLNVPESFAFSPETLLVPGDALNQ